MEYLYSKALQSFSSYIALLLILFFPYSGDASTNENICLDGDLIAQELGAMEASNCFTAPILVCPSVYFGCPDDSTHPNTTGWATAAPGDPNCIHPTLTYIDHLIVDNGCFKEIHREWTATYSDNTNPWLYSHCTQIIILRDIDDPEINSCPTNIHVTLDQNCNAFVYWTEPTATDDCGLQSFTSNYPQGYNFPIGNNLVVYTATDNCGNQSHCSFMITVSGTCCNETPEIHCPADYVGCLNTSSHPNITGYPTTVSDPSCPNPILTYEDIVSNIGNCNGSITIDRIWIATNPSDTSKKVSCTQYISLTDQTTPIIYECPTDTIIEVLSNVDSVAINWNAPSATDNCGLLSFTSNFSPGMSFPVGTTTVSYTAIDSCMNTSICSFDVTINIAECNSAPAIQCPPNYIGCIGTDIDPSITGYATASPGDSLCANPIITYKDHVLVNGPCPGRFFIRRIWTATDPGDSTLFSKCYQTLNIRTSRLPDIHNCPSDTTVTTALGQDSIIVTWTEPTATDECQLASFTSTHQPGDAFPIGITTVVYTATDECGNERTCSFEIEVLEPVCEDLPILTCPPYYIGCVGTSIDTSITGVATAVPGGPNCNQPIISFSDYDHIIGPCQGRIIVHRTWKATDPSDTSKYSTCKQIINLRDADPPVFSNCPADITIEAPGETACYGPAVWTVPTATDNCGLQNITSNYSPGDMFFEGTTTVQYTAFDNCGQSSSCSFDVTVVCEGCTTAPTIVCPSNYSGCPSDDITPTAIGMPDVVPGTMYCDQPLLSYIDDTITYTPCILIIDRVWTATDPNNWKVFSSCIQEIILEDNEAPTITNCPADITVTTSNMGCSVAVNWDIPVSNDNCGIASFTSNFGSGDHFDVGITTVTYLANDYCGNQAICSFDVTVECDACDQAPIIHCPSNGSTCPGSDYGPNVFGYATAVSNGANCGHPAVTFDDVIINSGPCTTAKVIERTWTATDPLSNLSASCVQTISLTDHTAPVIDYCPSNITVWASGSNCSKTVHWASPTATDNCQLSDLSSNYNSGTLFYEGVTTVIYTAVDACGNTAYCSFDVIVECNNQCVTPPNLYCPSNKTVCIGSSTSPSATGYPTATTSDANCVAPYVDYTDVIMSTGPCTGAKEIKRIWKAYYPGYPHLDVTCDQWITVDDNTAPVFSNVPQNITVSNCYSPVYWSPPHLYDDCTNIWLTSSHTPGTIFPAGTTTVYYWGEDDCGNTATVSFTVTCHATGNDLSCPADITLTCDGAGGAVIDWDMPTYTGTCGDCINGDPIPGFIYMGEYNGHQYYCSTSTSSWPVANQICQANGGYLASIGSVGENNFLANILTIQSAFIGLSDHQVEGNFEWTSGEPLSYTNWYPGQPNNSNNQDYVEMLNNGQWNDQYDYQKLEFIMEIPCNNIHQTAGPTKGSYVQAGTYHIVYELTDMCGVTSTCSFNVTVEGGITLTCPSDISVDIQSGNGTEVDWAPPIATSCCSGYCSTGSQISGFIYMGQFEGNHYYCSSGTATWNEANATCVALGGNLAAITSQEENDFLTSQLLTSRALIGFNDVANEGVYEWTTGEPFTYTNWYPGQPNNFDNNQHYGELLSNGQWNDTYADFKAEYILELPGCLEITQIGGPAAGSVFASNTTTTITYQATDGCGNLSTCSFDVIVNGNNDCKSGGLKSDLAYINSVKFGTEKIVTGNNGGYLETQDALDCFDIFAGVTYNIALEPGFTSTIKTVYWKVWIDFNMDGDYEDSGEYIAYGNGSSTLSGMITIPRTNIWNGHTRMRVAMKCGSYPTGPCEVFEYGETEDHCIRIYGADFDDSNDDLSNRSLESDASLLIAASDRYSAKVYPNPASNYFNLTMDDVEKISRVSMINSRGLLIQPLPIAKEQRIDLDRIPNGYYMIHIQYKDGYMLTKKLIVL